MGGEKVKADEAASVFREEIQKKVNDFKAVRAPQNPKAVLSFVAPSLCSRCDPHAHAPRAAAIFLQKGIIPKIVGFLATQDAGSIKYAEVCNRIAPAYHR